MLFKVLQLTFLCYLLAFPQPSQAQGPCIIEGISSSSWTYGFVISIRDTDVGMTFSGTTNIDSVPSSTTRSDVLLNKEPYLDFYLKDDKFVASLMDTFKDYEEYENSTRMVHNIKLPCSSSSLTIEHRISDTNNHYPKFIDDNIEIPIKTPMNAGVRIPYEIRVRDVDLSTTAIKFDLIGGSPLFEVVYERRDGKTFYGVLQTISVIIGLNEPLVLNISATDVDETGDAPLTEYRTITIISDPELSLPAPVFSQVFYSGIYNTDSGLRVTGTIQLVQGYNEDVTFSLSGVYKDLFHLTVEAEVATLHVRDDIPAIILETYSNLVVVVVAKKSLSIVASAPVFIELPLPRVIRFEQDLYVGAIYGTSLALEPIEVIEGFNDELVFTLTGDLAEYFSFFIVANLVVIVNNHTPLPPDVARNYDFLNLILEVTGPNTIRTVVGITLAVEGDDYTTPVFTQAYYTGSYNTDDGLKMDQSIALSQGFDNTVTFGLSGASILQFEYPSYIGRIWLAHELLDVVLPTITLSKGFQNGITFSIQEDYQNYFEVIYEDNVVTIKATDELQSADADNFKDLINIVLTATGPNSIPATTVLSLEVITADTNTPVFMKAIYEGSYDSDTGLKVYGDISLAQGFDETVLFSLSGDAVEHFEIQPNSHPVVIKVLNPISIDFMRANSHIFLSIMATKEWTVGASAILQINLPTFDIEPTVLQFQNALYSGELQGDNIILATIPLPSGYGSGVVLNLDGDYQEYFGITQTEENIEIYVAAPVPDNVLDSNTFLNLVLTAEGPTDDYISGFAVIVLEVDAGELIVPIFSQDYYLATYTVPNMIIINNGPISLTEETFDDDLVFEFVGEFAPYFSSQALGNFVMVSSTTPLPADVITSNAFINLQMTVSGPNHQSVTVIITTTILIDNLVPPEFNAVHYTGTFLLVSNAVSINGLIFLQPGFDPSVQFSIEGEFQEYFTITTTSPSVIIARTNVPIPEQVLVANTFFTLILTAGTATSSTSVVVTLAIDNGEVVISFNAEYYTGIYNPTTGITLDNEISITSGFDATMQYSLTGEYAEHFTANPPTNPITISAPDGVPSNILVDNTFITLILTVTGSTHIPAFRTITLEMISDTIITPVFSDIFYTGTLIAPDTVMLNSPVEIIEGFDESLQLVVSGEFEQYFSATPVTNPATITVTSPLPSDVLTEYTFVTLVLTATGPNHAPATTTITLEIADLIATSFERTYYTGLLTLPNVVNIDNPITVSEGFNEDLQFEISGEFGNYFSATSLGTNTINIIVSDDLPSGLLNEHTFITLVLTAHSSYHYSAIAIVTLEIAELITPRFDQLFYTGSLTVPNLIELHTPITVSEGFDDSLGFVINGDFEAYFTPTALNGVVSISLTNPLPVDLLSENAYITLVLTAFGANHLTVTVTVSLEIIIRTPVFDQIFYNGVLTLPNQIALENPIVVTDGFDDTLAFFVSGEYGNYFTATPSFDGTISLEVSSGLPSDTITENAFISLLVSASGPYHVSSTVTVNLEIADLLTPVFDQVFYTGTLTIPNTIVHSPITVSEGFDNSLQISIGEEFMEYFSATFNSADGTISIEVTGILPNEILDDSTFITLILIASGPNHFTTMTTLSLEIIELTTPVFNQIYYTGLLTLPEEISLTTPIIITEGFDNTLNFVVGGDYGTYFTATATEGTVNVIVSSQLPSETINTNAFITLTITASGPYHQSVTRTLSLEIAELIIPVFDQLFYTASLTPPTALVLDSQIIISSGFDETLQTSINGEFENFFTPSVTGNAIDIIVTEPLPIDILNDNTFITLVITAFGINHATVTTTVTIEIINLIIPVFDQIFYVGTLRFLEDVEMDTPIQVVEGFDNSIQFILSGEFGEYFFATPSANGIIELAVSNNLPSDTVNENTFITLVLTASGLNHVTVTTTITLEIIELTTPVFNQIYYTGLLTLPEEISLTNPIIITEGFDDTLNFVVGGEYGTYFTATATEGTINIIVSSELPSETINTNAFITLTITASGPYHQSVTRTLSLEIAELIVPVFDQLFYTGSLTPPTAIILDSPITVSSGFDETLQISINGEFENFFTATVTGNVIDISVTEPLPIDILNDNTFITLVITVFGINHATVTTTVTIEIINLITPVFDQIFYVGTLRFLEDIEMNTPIQVVEGFDNSIQFMLSGEFGEYFFATPSANGIIELSVSNDLPSDTVNENTFITLVLTASGLNHVTVTTTITLEIAELTTPVFDQVFYTGTLTIPNTINLHSPITVSEGFDNSLQISIGEEFMEYFSATPNTVDGIISIEVTQILPNEILDEFTYITLILIASGPNHFTTRTTLSLEILELTTPVFNQMYYTGLLTLPEDISLTNPIIITEGFDNTLNFVVGGDYGSYFTATATEGTVNVIVSSQLPSETINTNAFITLTITASGPNHQSVTRTLSLEIAELIVPVFDQLFYTGSLTPPTVIALDSPIIISSGFDETLQFSINGEFENFFTTTPTENAIDISVTEPLPIDVINDNTFITLVITAFGINHATVTTTVTIEITDLITPVFDQIFYVGTLRLLEDIVMNPQIQVIEGFDNTIQFATSGEFGEYFSATPLANGIIELAVSNDLPSDTVNENTFITLVLTASGLNHVTVTTTITLEILELTTPIFDQVFYTGSLTLPNAIDLHSPIIISEGFDETLEIAVGEDFINYFTATLNEADGTIIIALTTALPSEIFDENTFITLILIASGPNHVTTRNTLSLELFGFITPVFDQIYYTGVLNLPETIELNIPLYITEGFDETLNFDVGGDYASHFSASPPSNPVTITLTDLLPNEVVLENAFISLIITATGPSHIPTSTVVILEIVHLYIAPPVFDQVFYEGTYTSPGQVDFENPIALNQGFDENVIFDISGDQSELFSITTNTNPAIITAILPISEQVITDYTNLIFTVTATKPETTSATATIRINLPPVIVNILRFEHDYYVGYMEDDILNLESIILAEGYNGEITYNLHGEFSDHFVFSYESNAVTISLQIPLPDEIAQQVTFINIVLAASTIGYSVSTTTAITISINPIQTTVPVFSQTSYTGNYDGINGLHLDNEITLSQGFDETVTFHLSGAQATSFTVTSNGILVQISLEESIPVEVIAQNNHLLFSVNAVKEGTPDASSAVLIQLPNDVDEADQTEPTILEFSQNAYAITVTSNQLGLVRSITATANTRESILYSLETDNEHLRQNLQIGSTNGQIILSNYVHTGLYQVTVTATTRNTAVNAIVPISLRVDSIFICNNNNFLFDPLIIIDQIEEQAFSDIVILNEELTATCAYVITDSWPSDQPWFTIVDNNLSSTEVDREDPSIASMTLSQVQIELSLNCGPTQNALSSSANHSRSRRNARFSLQDDTHDGERVWLLSNEIKHTLERRVVNIVIHDINDNSPIFDDSENEPVVVGYPDADTLSLVTPPYLTRVHATDADIGINAHIRYTLSDTRLSIHPDTGVVYLMPDAMETLADRTLFDVYATDEYGLGNVGELNMEIRFLSMQYLAVLTINNAFLESQDAIRAELENALNYRVKILSARVSPDLNPVDEEEEPDVVTESPDPEGPEEESEEVPEEGPEEEPEEGPEEGPEEEPEEEPEGSQEVNLIGSNRNNLHIKTPRNVEEAPLLTLYIYAVNSESALVDANTLVQTLQNEVDNLNWIIVIQTLAEYTHESFWSGLVITIFVLGGVLLLIFLTFIGVVWFRIRQNKYNKFKDDGSVDPDNTTSRTSNTIILPKTKTSQPSSTQLYTPSNKPNVISAINSNPLIVIAGPTVSVTDETRTKQKRMTGDQSIDRNQKEESSTYFKFNVEGTPESTSL